MATQNQPLSLNDIRNNSKKNQNKELVPNPMPKMTPPVMSGVNMDDIVNEVEEDAKILTEEDNEEIDKEMENETKNDEEVSNLINSVAETTTIDEDEMDNIINEALEEEAKEIHEKAEQEAKEKSDDLFNDDNLELDDDAIYEKKQNEIKRKQEQDEVRSRWLELQTSFKEEIVNKNIGDIGNYKIVKKPMSINKIFAQDLTTSKLGSWGLYYAGIPLTMSEIGGAELNLIIPNSGNESIDQIQMFNIIHKHIVDPNKGTLEDFLKKFSFLDFPDILFTLYKATFKDSNYTYFTCPNDKCKKVFMHPMNIEDMVVYPDKETEDRMKKIIAKDPTTKSIITKGMVAVSPELVVSIQIPSIYKVLFEQQYISNSFKEKNREMNQTIMYIDEIYYRDRETKTLAPFDTRPDPNDIQKTAQRRVAIFSRILNKLSLEEYLYLNQRIRDYLDKYPESKIKYQFPAVDCPECGTHIEAQQMDPFQMVFYRRQLGRIVLSISPES